MKNIFIQNYLRLNKNDFKTWDPYDALIFFPHFFTLLIRKWGRIFLIHLFKRIPINLRPLFGKRVHNNKLDGLMLITLEKASSLKCFSDYSESFADENDKIFKRVIKNARWDNNSCGWGYSFPWQNRVFFQPAFNPTVVCTYFVLIGLEERYKRTKEKQILELFQGVNNFLAQIPFKKISKTSGAFSYSLVDNSVCYNASLLCAESITRLSQYIEVDNTLLLRSKMALMHVLSSVNSDGSLFYGEDSSQRWVDNFHTIYVLNSVEFLSTFFKLNSDKFNSLVCNHYKNNFMKSDGSLSYYINEKYHDDSHVYGTFLSSCNKNYFKLFFDGNYDTVWTYFNKNMINNYNIAYKKHRIFSNKIVYDRWSTSWILFSIVEMLINKSTK